jgi:hypothetical protein
LKNIFNSNRKMLGSVFQYFQEFFFSVIGQDIFKKIKVIDINHCGLFFGKNTKKD